MWCIKLLLTCLRGLFPVIWCRGQFKMLRQPTLGKFGFKKTIEHRGSQSSIRLPDFVAKTQTSVKCSGCSKTFVNQQGLTIHERCVHGVAAKRKTVVESSRPTKFQEVRAIVKSKRVCVPLWINFCHLWLRKAAILK